MASCESPETNQAMNENAKSLTILITGKTGSGKSTLINSLLGNSKEIAIESPDNSLASCTAEVKAFRTVRNNTQVTVWDSPGLQDGNGDDEAYIDAMKKECKQHDMILYCIQLGGVTKFLRANNPDICAMKKFTTSFGVDFWKNAVIVLTFANTLHEINRQEKGCFDPIVNKFESHIKDILVTEISIPKELVETIRIIPAGHYNERDILCTRKGYVHVKNWLSVLWAACLEKTTAQESLVNVSCNRIKESKHVDPSECDPLILETITNSLSQSASARAKTGLAVLKNGLKIAKQFAVDVTLAAGEHAITNGVTVGQTGYVIGSGLGGVLGTGMFATTVVTQEAALSTTLMIGAQQYIGCTLLGAAAGLTIGASIGVVIGIPIGLVALYKSSRGNKDKQS